MINCHRCACSILISIPFRSVVLCDILGIGKSLCISKMVVVSVLKFGVNAATFG